MSNQASTYIILPFDIIDCIITSNPETIISTYNKITTRKRQHNTIHSLLDLNNYLLNNKTKYLNTSPYFKYLNNIDRSMLFYTLLAKYIKKDNILTNNTEILLSNIENHILEYQQKDNAIGNAIGNVNNNYLKLLNKLVDIYKLSTPNELPDFIKIYLLLKSCNYLPLNIEGQTRILSVLDFILVEQFNFRVDNYLLQPEYKFIPVFSIPLGMGYNFMIGYDMSLDRLIGFIEGGSSGQEYEYNKMLIEKYMKLNKFERQAKYNTNIKFTSKSKKHNELLENIQKYLELFTIDIYNIIEHISYFNTMRLNILDN